MVDGFADVDGAGLSDQTIRFRRKEVASMTIRKWPRYLASPLSLRHVGASSLFVYLGRGLSSGP